MELLIKIKDNTLDSEIVKLISYLKNQNCVKKFDMRTNNFKKILNITDKETLNAMHYTSSQTIATFLENEKDSIF